jgi:hypothetical protein
VLRARWVALLDAGRDRTYTLLSLALARRAPRDSERRRDSGVKRG